MAKKDRKLTFRVFRYNPYAPGSKPHLQEYLLDETPQMTLYTVLTRIREVMDPSLQFDFSCRSAICGSCALLVNGRPRLACRTRTADLPRKITLLPLPFFRMVGDLSVDTGSWFHEMGLRLHSWIHEAQPFDPQAEEERMPNQQAQLIYELDRCIECGCCIAACGASQVNNSFLSPAGLMRMARFVADPRDHRSQAELFEVVGTEEGVFGCIGLLACDDYCPKDLPFAAQLAYLRRKMAIASLKRSPASKETVTTE